MALHKNQWAPHDQETWLGIPAHAGDGENENQDWWDVEWDSECRGEPVDVRSDELSRDGGDEAGPVNVMMMQVYQFL